MIDVIYYILLAMVGIYATWIFLSKVIKNVFDFKICAICATVVSTWGVLLTLKLAGYAVNQIIIAVLMGESVAGFMYLLERRAESTKNKKLLLMKPLVILFGTLVVYLILSGAYK
ncbi:MAG: hypothetical protein HYW22_03000 [Candidatus Aenigmarchaeota archaeon]|nr:hypothetical protein [Candidatus Aenigmarchaeota archaeon]